MKTASVSGQTPFFEETREDRPMECIYRDQQIYVAIKPAGVLSTDEPGGMPELVRQALGTEGACVRTVHRLDRVVSGLMVLALTPESASELSRQMREQQFHKSYLAVLHGTPEAPEGTLTDLLIRDKRERKTYVAQQPGKGVQEAVLDYRVLETAGVLSLVQIWLRTGRTHQIRAQFSARGLPLVGDRKYSTLEDGCKIALWSYQLSFFHPQSKERLSFSHLPPKRFPWAEFRLGGQK